MGVSPRRAVLVALALAAAFGLLAFVAYAALVGCAVMTLSPAESAHLTLAGLALAAAVVARRYSGNRERASA